MKKLYFYLLSILLPVAVFAQYAPIAVDDYATVTLFDSVTVNVISNDYDPDGSPFSIYSAWTEPYSHTDSTITFYCDYKRYWNHANYDTIRISYAIIDADSNISEDSSMASLKITIQRNCFEQYLDTNNINALIISANGQFWNGPQSNPDNTLHKYEFPKGGGKQTIFNSAFWIGGLDDNDSLHLAGERYQQVGLDFWTGPISKTGNLLTIADSTVNTWFRIWKLTVDEVAYHKLHYLDMGYQPIEAIATWPGNGNTDMGQLENIAPYVDVDNNGIYQPMNGDYPLIRGDQCIFYVLNDLRPHGETNGGILGIEIHVMAYEFNKPDSAAYNNTLFFHYEIINRSENTYHNTFFGMFTDLDLGYDFDDYVGCNVNKGFFYAYNGDSIDGNGEEGSYGSFIPVQTVAFLGGPTMDANGVDDPAGLCNESLNGVGFGDGIIDNERYGMTRFIFFNNSGDTVGDPRDAPEYYNYLIGKWKDSSSLMYGGAGYPDFPGTVGPECKFMWPGDSDTCNWGTNGQSPNGGYNQNGLYWNELTGNNGNPYPPCDIRGLGSTGPFTFMPHSTQSIDIAYVSAFPTESNSAIDNVINFIDTLKTDYKENSKNFGSQWLGWTSVVSHKVKTTSLTAYPNPASTSTTIFYHGSITPVRFIFTDITGKTLITGYLSDTKKILNLSPYPSGLYIVRVIDGSESSSIKILKK